MMHSDSRRPWRVAPTTLIKLNTPPVHWDERGSLAVPPKLNACHYPLRDLQKIPCVMQQGMEASVTLFRYVATLRLYPCSITGAPELGYLFARSPVQLGGPFDFCAFALLSPQWFRYLRTQPPARLSENRFEVYSSSSAFLNYVGRDFTSEGGMCQGENLAPPQSSNNLRIELMTCNFAHQLLVRFLFLQKIT
jgi:hypothetical protein